MEKEECWATFLESGKVTDYLNYKQVAENTAAGEDDRVSGYEDNADSAKGSGNRVKHNAGFY